MKRARLHFDVCNINAAIAPDGFTDNGKTIAVVKFSGGQVRFCDVQ
jgi:hypothetical protein